MRKRRWIGLYESTFYQWVRSYGKAYEHNGAIPRDHWLEDWEKDAIIKFHFEHPLDGYRRLTYIMIDADIVAVSAATVYRVLSAADLLGRKTSKTKTKARASTSLVRHIDTGTLTSRTSTSVARFTT